MANLTQTPINILLFGRGGQVATVLEPQLRLLGDVTALGSKDCDFAEPENVMRAVDAVRPSVIVNAAAYTAVDQAEVERKLAFLINAEAVEVMAQRAHSTGALLVHYSTDYVFAGDKRAPYLEEDTCNPLSVYGESKRDGEIRLRDSGANHMLFRTGWVYSATSRNFLKTMVDLALHRESLRVVADQIGAPTHAATVATGTTLAIRRWLESESEQRKNLQGTFHLTASGSASWWDFTEVIVKCMREQRSIPCTAVSAITTAEFPRPARRPAYSVLDNTRIQEVFGIHLADWRLPVGTTVRQYLESMSQ